MKKCCLFFAGAIVLMASLFLCMQMFLLRKKQKAARNVGFFIG